MPAVDELFCVVETSAGKIQGLVSAGVRQFKGVPYGAHTGGANRFQPPREPIGWSGVRECFGYGQVSPQIPTEDTHRYGRLVHFDLAVAEGGMGEDCLNLNIWTPGLGDGAKRAVMVSLHGGGFAIGSGNAAIYDGAQLARLGDVVVVTVNHRLASFGFLDLVDVGAPADFGAAGVAGIMDIVAALEWVRDHIVNFGGDPGRVMVFGQSGGGWKTSTLLAAPAAKGLFHSAAIQSGSWLRHLTREAAAAVSASFIAELGLTARDVFKIQYLPWQSLLAAQSRVGAQAFAPVLDGTYLPHHPFDPEAPEESAETPLIISTTLDDAGLFFNNFELNEDDLRYWLEARFGAVAEEMLRLYRRTWPRKPPFLLQAQIITDAGFRRLAHAQAERKVAQGLAPVYLYRWDWPTPAFDGIFGAVHATDAAAAFGNAREAIVGSGSQPGRGLSDALRTAWIAFAKTGDPANDLIPPWPKFDVTRRPTMIFDDPIRVVSDPNQDIRTFWAGMPQASSILG